MRREGSIGNKTPIMVAKEILLCGIFRWTIFENSGIGYTRRGIGRPENLEVVLSTPVVLVGARERSLVHSDTFKRVKLCSI